MNWIVASAASSAVAPDMIDAPSTPLRVVLGPTAAGKSALAMQLAEARGLAIISADSRQLYRGFDIGTAKPTAAEQARVRHYGLDLVSPTERVSAQLWAEGAHAWLRDASMAGRPPLIVGGTGFYVRALVAPLDEAPALDPQRRRALEQATAKLDAREIARWCQRLDPARAHLGRTQQLRAIETALLAGVRLSEAQNVMEPPRLSPRAVRYLVVDPGLSLHARIAARVAAMVDAGWLAEVEALMRTLPPDAPAWTASGYTTMRDFLLGHLSRAAAIERVIIDTRQYAKRQRTWFRHQLQHGTVTTLDPAAPDALRRAMAWLDADPTEHA